MSDNFVRAFDLQEDVIGQLEANATMPEVLDAPEGLDDEQWSFPYGRISMETSASYDSAYGRYEAFASFSGIVEESELTGKFFLDKDGVMVKIVSPEGDEYRLEWAEEDLASVLDELRGGYTFWNLPNKDSEFSFFDYILYEPDDEMAGASLAKYICEAFAEQVNYKNVMGR